MQRELPRTLHTMTKEYQRGIDSINYEIVVVDNGSSQPVFETELRQISPNIRVLRFEPGNPSPVKAINLAVKRSSSAVVGLFIDGARMLSPGILRHALDAHRCDPTKIIGTLAFHLGPEVQMESVAKGYNQETEDALLAKTPWREDGYSLFDICVLAGSSASGWFGSIAESNGVFLDRSLWNKLGGMDERFKEPGGGTVNLDFWRRAVIQSNYEPWILLGEGTFHQVHGGVATNGPQKARDKMFEEYHRLRGEPFQRPSYKPRFIGTISKEMYEKFNGKTV